MNFNVLGHQIGDAYRSVVSMFKPVNNTVSKFESHGQLTPEEFLAAGDQLVFKFPTWQWSGASSSSLEKSYLPKNKQFLITRHVPCNARVRQLDSVIASSTRQEEDWTIAGIAATTTTTSTTGQTAGANNTADIPDISDLSELDNMLLAANVHPTKQHIYIHMYICRPKMHLQYKSRCLSRRLCPPRRTSHHLVFMIYR